MGTTIDEGINIFFQQGIEVLSSNFFGVRVVNAILLDEGDKLGTTDLPNLGVGTDFLDGVAVGVTGGGGGGGDDSNSFAMTDGGSGSWENNS